MFSRFGTISVYFGQQDGIDKTILYSGTAHADALQKTTKTFLFAGTLHIKGFCHLWLCAINSCLTTVTLTQLDLTKSVVQFHWLGPHIALETLATTAFCSSPIHKGLHLFTDHVLSVQRSLTTNVTMSFCSGIHALSAGLLQLSTDCISDTASISRKYTAVVSVARLARLHLHRPHWPPDVSRLFL